MADSDDWELSAEEFDLLEKDAIEKISSQRQSSTSSSFSNPPMIKSSLPPSSHLPSSSGTLSNNKVAKLPSPPDERTLHAIAEEKGSSTELLPNLKVKLDLHPSGVIAAKFPYHPILIGAFHKIPKSTWHAKERLWMFPISSLSIAEEVLREIDGANVQVQSLDNLVRRALSAASSSPDLLDLYARMPSFVESKLLPFQREGIRFLLQHGGRALLADEMGLGKTLQAIAFAACLQDHWPVLIITPSSLRLHWASTIQQWLDIRPSDILVKKYEVQFHLCMERMVQNAEIEIQIITELESYKNKKGRFGVRTALLGLKTLQPITWWDTYGLLTPNLQVIAIRILGLTVTASNCERNWSTFEIIQSKRRSSLDPERLSKLVFIKYNKALHERFMKKKLENKADDYDPLVLDDINYSSEWMTGKAGAFNEFVYEEGGLTWAEVVLSQCGGSNKMGFNIVHLNLKESIHLDGLFNILSYDIVPKLQDLLLASEFKVIIADESHFLKNAQAKRTSACLPILQRASYAILLSGTPALSRPIEIFKQLEALYPNVYRNVHEYGTRYCKGGLFGLYQGASNQEELHNLMKATVMIRRLKKDVLTELPKKRRQQVFLNLKEKDMKQVKILFRELEVIKNNIETCGTSKSDESLQLSRKQIINKIYNSSAEAKIPAVLDYLSTLVEAGCKFLIFAHHQPMIDSIHQYLQKMKVGCIRIDGNTASSARQELVNKFQEKEDIRAAVLSIKAGGVGLTLTAASTVIFAELSWNPGDIIQAEDRAHRIGQASAVNVYYLLANDTVDDIMWDVIQNKLENLGQVLDGRDSSLEVCRGEPTSDSSKQPTLDSFLKRCHRVTEEQPKAKAQRKEICKENCSADL